MAISRVSGTLLPAGNIQALRGQQRPQLQRISSAQTTNQRTADQVTFSAESTALSRLVRTWGALSSLFGGQPAQGEAGWSLAALRETLAQARRNAEVMDQRKQVMNTLKTSALRQAEALVDKYYGLKGDGATLGVVFDDNLEGALASLSYVYDQQGRMVNQQMHINMKEFLPDSGPNGTNSHVIQNDRIVAHEMTHAVMGRNMDMAVLPDWFAEGTAEYIGGGAERVSLMLNHYSPTQLINRLQQPWEGDSSQYAAAYVAVRYLDESAAAGGGIKAVMASLKEGDSLDKAISTVSGGQWADTRQFLQELTGGQGAAYLRTIDLSGRDAGSIKPGPGPAVVPDMGVRTEQPLRNFRVQWPLVTDGLSFGGTYTPWPVALGAYGVQTGFVQRRV
ncbi:MAG TPA: flagellinolysin [Symbiobacteriaceae bacterium]|nr:flagellinolysin [Symbiobacteriaceae bacterium]